MNASALPRRRRWFAPEVVQTSAMDCGPATLKCLLEGFGIPVSYGRLREACQTDVDGTSIDTMEEIARQLGLEAEQVMMPVDHLLLPEADALPAILVVRHANGLTHFVVVWRRHGPFVQLMDPSAGRRWITGRRLMDEVYSHEFALPAVHWREWAGSEDFLGGVRRRLAALGLDRQAIARLAEIARADPGWHALASLDAATRMVDTLVRSGGLRRGPAAKRVLQSFLDVSPTPATGQTHGIPDHFWTVRSASPGAGGEEQVLMRGAVLVRVSERCATKEFEGRTPDESRGTEPDPLPPELAAALAEKPCGPGRQLWRWLLADGLRSPALLVAALALAAAGVVLEAILLRGLLDLGRELTLTGQRLGAIGVLLLFVTGLLFLEWSIVAGWLRAGRRLEIRLRMAFLKKIPRLLDRYFHSRPTSDMAERSHSVHTLRLLPELGGQFLRSGFELVLTTAGIVWLDPASAPFAIPAAILSLGLPLLAHPLLTERDLRIRTHAGALGRFYLDALLGLVPVRAHGAERAIRSEHESLLVPWARANLQQQRVVVGVEAVQSFAGIGLAAWLLHAHLARTGESGSVLLLVYWALQLPMLGQEIALIVRQYPEQRSLALRLFEPLGASEGTGTGTGAAATAADGVSGGLTRPSPAVESEVTATSQPGQVPAPSGVAIRLEGVSVRAAGHTILDDLNLDLAPGSQVAIVGPSGAGKSSLAGLLLGWHHPYRGQVIIDGVPLDGAHLDGLRRQTAWVDPTVQLWNRSFIENLGYGKHGGWARPLDWVIRQATLLKLIETLPDGMRTTLGEGGALVSGGEGQRIRLGRAMLRPGIRLVILDEPFRGLDRDQRQTLLARVRELWNGATLLCITHDIRETLAFDRVLVIEKGRIAEDGDPVRLAKEPASRYRDLLEAEDAVREGLWSGDVWRRWRLEGGRITEKE